MCRGANHYEGECVAEENGEGAKCCNCSGDHEVKSLECPIRVKETEIAKIGAVQRVSYVEAVKRVERLSISECPMVVNACQPTHEYSA